MMLMPASPVQGPTHIRPGFELGVTPDNKNFYVFNHLVFNVLIHRTDGAYTRAQNSAYAKSLAVDTSGRRLLAWPEGTPDEVQAPLEEALAFILTKLDGTITAHAVFKR